MKTIELIQKNTTLRLLNNNLKYEVVQNGVSWVGNGRRAHIFFQKKLFGKYLWLPKRFSMAHKIEHKVIEDSIISTYSNFILFGKKLPIKLIVTAKIIENGKIDFSLKAENEDDMYVKALCFPQAFNAKKFDRKESYSVDSRRQGAMLPDNRKSWFQKFLMTAYWRKINTGDAYLGVWGRVCGKAGYSAVIENSYDCTVFSSFGKKGAFLTSVNFISSLGKVSYERLVHYHFMDDCDYVKIAKDFRANEIKKGEFKSIDEKIKENPNVKKLIGAPVIHWRVLLNTSPLSKYVKITGPGRELRHTFQQSLQEFKHFKELGLEKAYIHIDGWGKNGYDNLHPYVLPPAVEAGGWEGMHELAEGCKDINYTFGIHDQYRDFYQDCELYDANIAVTDINGVKPYCDFWAGGPHNWLCGKFALDFLKKTYTELKEHDIDVQGAYLDVYGIMWGDECYHKDHIVTREESIKYRGECFDYLRSHGIIASSEELGCNMVRYLDLVHHSSFFTTPQEGKGAAFGIPIPFANLVYHDSAFVPWDIDGKGSWGVPATDSGLMHCILYGQTPYFCPTKNGEIEHCSDEELKLKIKRVNEACAVNAKVYNAEMVSHRFLDKNYRIQQTVFSNGVKITVDFDKDTYKVEE